MKNLYFFSGEKYQREKAIKKKLKEISENLSLDVDEVHLDGEEIEARDLIEEIISTPLFAQVKLIWVKNAERIGEQSILTKKLNESSLKDTYIIFESNKRGNEVALYKLTKKKGVVKHFAQINRRNLPKVVKTICKEKGVRLTKDAFRYFLELIEVDLQRIDNEITKLSWFANNKDLTIDEICELTFTTEEKNVFQFLDAIGSRNSKALKTLRKLLGNLEDPGKIFYMLAEHIRSLLMIKSMSEEGFENKEIAKRTLKFEWLVKKKKHQARNFSQKELIEVLQIMHQEDLLIKRGQVELENCLFKIALYLLEGKSK